MADEKLKDVEFMMEDAVNEASDESLGDLDAEDTSTPEEAQDVQAEGDELDEIAEDAQAVRENRSVQRQYRPDREITDDTMFFVERDTGEKERRKRWETLQNLYRRKGVIAGRVIEVRPMKDSPTVLILVRIDDDFTAIIRDEDFFTMQGFRSDYYDATEQEKKRRRAERARACIDAWVPFVIVGMSVERGKDGLPVYSIVGDRRAALKQKVDKYFYGSHPVQEGDIATAEVISVGENLAFIETLGVESAIPFNEITAYKFVTDARDVLSPGKNFKVVIRRIHRNEDGSIGLNVSGSAVGYREMRGNTQELKVGSAHSGTVRNYNANRRLYTVITDGGATVAVDENAVIGGELLLPGDHVSVVVTRVLTDMAFGTAKRR